MTHDPRLYATWWARLRPLPGAPDLLRACADRGLAVEPGEAGAVETYRDPAALLAHPDRSAVVRVADQAG